MRALLLVALAGAVAQLIDGGIGMGFGATSTTLLLLGGLAPAQASAVVHAAELGTTLISGFSHWRFGNVDWSIVTRLGIPGAVAAFAGATCLSHLSSAAAAPLTAAILIGIGCNLIWRFSRPKRPVPSAKRAHSTAFLAGLGTVGGFIDATGGGGWGPVSSSTLMALGKHCPRRIVGTVNTAEFLVTAGATAGFIVGLWSDIVANAAAVIALLIGGALTAPVAAWLVTRINPLLLGGFVGTALVAFNLDKAIDGVELYVGVGAPAWLTPAAITAAVVIGAGVTLRRQIVHGVHFSP